MRRWEFGFAKGWSAGWTTKPGVVVQIQSPWRITVDKSPFTRIDRDPGRCLCWTTTARGLRELASRPTGIAPPRKVSCSMTMAPARGSDRLASSGAPSFALSAKGGRKERWDEMVRPERFELPTFWFVARRSIQLSYGRTVKPGILPYDGQGVAR